MCILNIIDLPFLTTRGIDKAWLGAGSVLVAMVVAGALWWRWFKWHIHAADLTQHAPGSR